MHHRKAQSRSSAHALGGKERVPGAGQRLGAHAAPGVGHRELQVLSLRKAQAHWRRSVGGGGDGDHTSVGHGVASIDREVEERHFQLVRIRQDKRQSLGQDDVDTDRGADSAFQQFLNAADEAADIEGLGFQFLPTRERELGRCLLVSACACLEKAIAVYRSTA